MADFSFEGINRQLPVKTSGAKRKSFSNFGDFEVWLKTNPFKVFAAFEDTNELSVLLKK